MSWAVAPCWARANIVVCSIQVEVGGQVEYFSRYPLVFGGFYEEVWDQGRVWELSGNFDKDLLVLRLDFLRVL